MINWAQGGPTASLRLWAKRELRQLQKHNRTLKGAQYPFGLQLLRNLLEGWSFGRLLATYFLANALAVLLEFGNSVYLHQPVPHWATFDTNTGAFLKDATSYLIAAQVGMLGTVSIAVGLVTLIAQRENSSTDVQIYYRESLAYELVASSIALVVVLSVQIFWPLQFFSSRIGISGPNYMLKVSLTSMHVIWLVINCWAMAHFVRCTLNFVQPNRRRKIREQYTANYLIPTELPERVVRTLYLGGADGLTRDRSTGSGPFVFFGSTLSGQYDDEVEKIFKQATILFDVRMKPVRWVIRRWLRRNDIGSTSLLRRDPVLCFVPTFDGIFENRLVICRTSEGARLTWLERQIVRNCFVFRRVPS